MKKCRLLLLFLLISTFCSAIFTPSAHAISAENVEVGQLFAQYVYLVQGTTYEFETQSLTGGDPVMRLLKSTTLGEVAMNDNNGDLNCHPFFGCSADLDARMSYTPSSTEAYILLIHSKNQSEAGQVDVLMNQNVIFQNAPYGGAEVPISYDIGDRFRATSRSREPGCNALVLFLIKPGCGGFCQKGIVEGDIAYSGPNYDATFVSNSPFPSNSKVLVGLSGSPVCSSGTADVLVTVDEDSPGAADDQDGDLLSASFESLIGTSDFDQDSDHDNIPDYKEVHGNTGFSYATGGYNEPDGPTPATTRNIYLSMLVMPGTLYQPPPGIEQQFATTFAQDSDDGVVFEWVESIAIPRWDHVGLRSASCSTLPDCTSTQSLKQLYFTDASKLPHFRVGVMGHLVAPDPGSSGIGEIGGNEFVVANDILNGLTGSTTLEGRKTGTILHELGHNLSLTHNFNDNAYGTPWSSLHGSVMNYLYQFTGVGAQGAYTYSTGTYNSQGQIVCNSCQTSNKGWCQTLRNNNACFIEGCDCDRDEWSVWMTLDYFGSGNASGSPGMTPGHRQWGGGLNGYRAADRPGPFTSDGTLPAPLPNEVMAPTILDLQNRTAATIAYLNSLGLIEDQDYWVTPDHSAVYMP